MFGLLFCSAAAGEGLGGAACTHKDQHSHRDDGDDDGQQHLAHLSPQLHDACGGRHKQQREDAGEEQAHFLDLLELHDAEAERGQEQQQAVDAGRDGEREHCVADLAQKTERQNARKVKHIEKFLVEMGAGFAFMGRQYHIEVSGDDYYIDILMYNTFLHRYLVIELIDTEFMPEYIGKLNFYCSAVDDILCREGDNRTIGLLLCKSKDRIKAEYDLRDIQKPIGISDYELGQALPKDFRGSLPTIEEIEKELESDSH